MKTFTVVRSLASRLMLRPAAVSKPDCAVLWAHSTPAPTPALTADGSNRIAHMRRLGFILILLSFATPDLARDGTGIGAFLLAPVAAWFALSHAVSAPSLAAALLGTLLVLAWLANVTIFLRRLPSALSWLSMAAPWALYLAILFRSPDYAIAPEMLTFMPFYLWAIGLGLIHGSRLQERKPSSDSYVQDHAAQQHRAA